MAITSTGGYIGRIYWTNSGVHPDFEQWGSVQFIPDGTLHWGPSCWAGSISAIRQIINWRFYDHAGSPWALSELGVVRRALEALDD